jgi:hypothetical protein
MKYLFVLASYSDYRQKIFDEIISPRNKQYCDIHGYKYVEIRKEHNPQPFRGNYTWNKFSIVKELLDAGTLRDGDMIVNLDADMYIVDLERSLEPNSLFWKKSFAYSVDSGNTHCMGWYSMVINDWSKNLINNILSEGRYQKLKDKISIHDRFKTYSSFWSEFREQASWYSLAGIKRHSDKSFWDYDHDGFHSEFNEDVVYSLDELKEYVRIFPSSYNVTEWEGESSCQFNINKVDKENVVIRHFAGGQSWNNIHNWIK